MGRASNGSLAPELPTRRREGVPKTISNEATQRLQRKRDRLRVTLPDRHPAGDLAIPGVSGAVSICAPAGLQPVAKLVPDTRPIFAHEPAAARSPFSRPIRDPQAVLR